MHSRYNIHQMALFLFISIIYFGHLYIDHHLANIARIGTAISRQMAL